MYSAASFVLPIYVLCVCNKIHNHLQTGHSSEIFVPKLGAQDPFANFHALLNSNNNVEWHCIIATIPQDTTIDLSWTAMNDTLKDYPKIV